MKRKYLKFCIKVFITLRLFPLIRLVVNAQSRECLPCAGFSVSFLTTLLSCLQSESSASEFNIFLFPFSRTHIGLSVELKRTEKVV